MNKKVFISYSWGSKEHQDWVINLGKRLMNDTVDVVLDKWSLKDGHDIYSFMEEMVKSKDIFRVLIISDSKYKEKANDREGGVGTETQIITPNIYSNQKQEKFIPLVLERNEDGSPSLPVYLSNRKYIDFSKEEYYEDSYEELLRNILEKPALPKPKLGIKPPVYIEENQINLFGTNSKIRTIENQIKKSGNINPKYLYDFTESFLEILWEFHLKGISSDLKIYGEQLILNLKSYKPLREDFIKLVDLLSDCEFDSDIIIEFFEKAPTYQKPRENVGSWNSAEFDIFKIIFHELFLNVIAICLKNQDYNLISELLNSKYYTKDPFSRTTVPTSFIFLYSFHENLESYSSNINNREGGFANYVISNLSEQITKENLILADTICYVIFKLNNPSQNHEWYPKTFIYHQERQFTFFEKFTSKKHFEKLKTIFDVSNIGELKNKIEAMKKMIRKAYDSVAGDLIVYH